MKRAGSGLGLLSLLLLLASCSSDSPHRTLLGPDGGGGTGGSGSPSGGAAGSGSPNGGAAGSGSPSGGTAGNGSPNGGAAGAGGTGAGGSPEGGTAFDGTCATLPGKVVYVESGDTQENLLKRIGRHLRDTANVTLAFNLTGSCTLTNDVYTNAKMVPNGTLKYVPSTAEDPTWVPANPEPTCTTGPDGVSIDVAISALFVESCGLGGPPPGSGLALIQGPVQAYTFVVPTASDQNAIWAEEAYYTFGFGNGNPLAPTYDPWNDVNFMFIRPTTKSTLVATAANISVPPAKWKGTPEAASGDVVNAVVNSTNAEATIGILGAEVYDANRTKGLKTLAFRAFNQKAAYYPDSTSSAFDKQNVRDGHYTLWSPTVYITKVDASNTPTNPAVATFMDAVLGTGDPGFDGLAEVVKVGLVPQCAMQVTRSTDGGDLSPASPPASCTCYYLSQVPGASGTPAGCTACADNSTCGGGTCNHGFCEPDAIDTAGTPGNCFSGTPATNADFINACTTATAVNKNVVLPSPTLEPLP
jgi:hypothetical protein